MIHQRSTAPFDSPRNWSGLPQYSSFDASGYHGITHWTLHLVWQGDRRHPVPIWGTVLGQSDLGALIRGKNLDTMKNDGDAIEQHLDVSQCQKVSATSHRGKVQDGDLDRGGRWLVPD
ncbi:hypothetical protein [Paramagnetospirillum magnetotacticum]|nr:hypothetical protein [Paramagnetospirillum magnetotacticum]